MSEWSQPVGALLGVAGATVLVWALVLRVVATRRGFQPPAPVVWTLAAAGLAALVGSLTDLAASSPALGDRAVVLSLVVLLPAALILYPDGRPPPVLGWSSVALVVSSGLVAVAYPEIYASSGLAVFLAYLFVLALQWWRAEHADARQRRQVVWLGLGGLPGPVLVFLVAFVNGYVASISAVLAVVAALVCLGVGLVAPDVRDVRAVTVTVAVQLTAGMVVVTLYATMLSGLALLEGHEPRLSPGAYGVLAALCIAVHLPLARLLHTSAERLLFGDRRDPFATVSLAGEHIGDEPVLVLRSLRESLVLPYAGLVSGSGEVLAASGTAPGLVVSVPLAANEPDLGRLDVGLRPGEQRLSEVDRVVLQVLAPALGQVVRAHRLSSEVQASRARVVVAVEDERRRLRRELHDGLGPRMTALAYTADAARNVLESDPQTARRLLHELRGDAGDAIAEVRLLVEGLRPPSLDQLGLEMSLRQHARGLRASGGRDVGVELLMEELPALSAAAEVTVYRIVVEALTNAVRHSSARSVVVRVHADDATLHVEVTDDGGPLSAWTPGVGLTSMRERVELLDGELRVEATPTGGLVSASIPMAEPRASEPRPEGSQGAEPVSTPGSTP